MELQSVSCCGIREFSGVYNNTPQDIIEYIACDRFDWDEDWDSRDRVVKKVCENENYRYVIFSDTSHEQARLKALMDFIKVNKVGSCVKTKPNINPNTTNILQVCVWTISDRGLKSFFKKHCK